MVIYNSKEEVHNRGYDAVGKSISELMNEMNEKLAGKKAQVGYAWESWFGVESNSEAHADLPEVGIELKATGVKQTKNGPSAKERLVLNIINYIEEYDSSFETSSFWLKNRYMELGFYGYDKTVDWKDWIILKSVLFTYPEKDLLIIKDDWEKIHRYIKSGRAHELSEGLTMYLGACTKGVNKQSVRDQHPSLKAPKAMQRAYSLKSGYMTYLLRQYIFGDKEDTHIRTKPFQVGEVFEKYTTDYQFESIIKDISILKNESLEQYILNKLYRYQGKTIEELAILFQIEKNQQKYFPKSINAMLISRMLGLYGDISKTEEFFKANIQVKTINITNSKRMKESMSFPTFNFRELCVESWETSTFRDMLDSSKFFFIVFKENNKGEYVFQGGKFWSMPEYDLETIVKGAWQETVDTLNYGVKLVYEKGRVKNNFIKASDNRIIHVRPHAAKASYMKNDTKNADELPVKAHWTNKPDTYSEDWMTKQCFWLNNNYILEQIETLI